MPAELEDGQVPARVEKLANYLGILFGCALLWASFAQIREVVIAGGAIIPSGQVQQLQHLEGGEVEKVLAIEGQIVQAGAPLLRLRPTAAASDLNQLRVRAASKELHQIALTALIQGVEPDFSRVGRDYPDLTGEQEQLYRSKRDQLEQQRRTHAARTQQKEAEEEALRLETQSVERQKAIHQEQLDIRAKLLKDGYTSKRAYLATESELQETTARLAATRGRLHVAREQLVEVRSLQQGAEAEFMKNLSEERSTASAELAELREQITKYSDRVDRLVVRAPVNGIVQELAQKTTGEVVKPGDLVAKIVPLGDDVVAEVKIEPRDIGHVNVGDAVEVKLSTFDPSIFGVAKGRVEIVSATTFTDEEGRPYYKSVVKLEDNRIGAGAKQKLITPGMVVEADIITGSKSLVKYLLAPVYRSLDYAFSER
ncbi:MAG: HlyD family type I secretion periplasmic adaptor subunit [Pseudomonadota bacterium]|nr:HlyD family type I secretion periplasmic adaptor subunit [Pseudomonadota bacterium]